MNIRHDHFQVSRWRLRQQFNRTVKILLNFEEKSQIFESSKKVGRRLRSIWSQSTMTEKAVVFATDGAIGRSGNDRL